MSRWSRKPPHATQCGGVAKRVLLLGERLVGAIADVETLVAVLLGRRQILQQRAIVILSRFGVEMTSDAIDDVYDTDVTHFPQVGM